MLARYGWNLAGDGGGLEFGLLHGQLTVVTTDGKTLSLKEGEPIVEVVKTAHYGINRGDQPAEILVVYAGTTNLPITVMMGK